MNQIKNTTTTPCSLAPITNACVGPLKVEFTKHFEPLKEKCSVSLFEPQAEAIKLIFIQCVANNDIPGFLSLSCIDARHYMIAQIMLMDKNVDSNGRALQFCPGLTILNPFNLDMSVNLFKVIKLYHKLLPTVENDEGNQGLTLQIR